MVNHISPVQENRMIQKSLEELDEETISAALGIKGLTHRLNTALLSQLHADAATALDKGQITLTCARELTCVKPERQEEILAAMAAHNDYSIAFARALILKTPPKLRTQKRRHASNPWDQSERKKGNLLKRLQDTEQKHDFYSRLYRQYSVDLLKLVIYARSLVTNKQVRAYMDQHHSAVVARFLKIIAQAEA
jgi:ParB family chromosome partitioning protein